jgi:hypothetical protein
LESAFCLDESKASFKSEEAVQQQILSPENLFLNVSEFLRQNQENQMLKWKEVKQRSQLDDRFDEKKILLRKVQFEDFRRNFHGGNGFEESDGK